MPFAAATVAQAAGPVLIRLLDCRLVYVLLAVLTAALCVPLRPVPSGSATDRCQLL